MGSARNYFATGILMMIITVSLLSSWNPFADAAATVFDNYQNISNNAGISDFPQTSTNGENVYLVWKDTSSGNADIYLAKSNDSGENFGVSINLSNNVGASSSPQVASNDNRVYVVWSDNTPGNSDILFRASGNDGQDFGSIINLSTNPGTSSFPIYEDHTGGVQANAQIAAFDSNVYVVWQDTSNANGEIYYIRSADGGASFGSGVNLSTNPAQSQYPVLLTTDNYVFITWEDKSSGNSEIYFRRSIDGGATFENALNLSSTSGGSFRPKLAYHEDSLFLIWVDNSLGKTNLYFKSSTNAGASFADTMVLTDALSAAGHHQITASSDDKVYVVWRDGPNPIKEVYFRASEDGGASFESAINLSSNEVDSAWGQIAARGDSVYVSWRDTPPGSKEVYFRESHDGGHTFENTVNLSNNAGTSGIPLQALGENSIYVVWRDATPGNYEILFKRGTTSDAGTSLPPITTASPPGGLYGSALLVTLTANEPSITYFTIDGSTPTIASGVYSSPISVSTDTTLKFFSIDTNNNSESVQTQNYFINDISTPKVFITFPSNGATVTGPSSGTIVNLVGTSSDIGSGVLKVEVKVTDPVTLAPVKSYEITTAVSPGDWSTWSHTMVFVSEGSYRITARVTDNSGNQGWNSKIINVGFS